MIFPKKFLGLFLIVVTAGSLIYFLIVKPNIRYSEKDKTGSLLEEAVDETETPLPVQVKKVERGELIIKLRSPGEAVTDRMVVVKTEVSGKVRALFVREGQSVQKGELLVELDNREFLLEVERANASRLKILSELLLDKQFAENSAVDDALYTEKILDEKQNYEKAYQQYQQGLMSLEEFEGAFKKFEMIMIESGQKKEDIIAATKGLTQQEINLKKARLDLEKTLITAPFAGVITGIKVSEQQQVPAFYDLFTVVNAKRVSVHAKVLESEIGAMRVGRDVDLFFSAFPEEKIKGKVKVVSPLVNSDDKTCNVIISINQSETIIKPGMHAEVEIEAVIFKDVLLVPQEAILVRGGKKMVYVVEENIARSRTIETGRENDQFAEVLESNDVNSGLREGEVVIVEGHYTLAQNARVRILED